MNVVKFLHHEKITRGKKQSAELECCDDDDVDKAE